MNSIRLILLGCAIFIAAGVFAQNAKVSGTVISAKDNQPIPSTGVKTKVARTAVITGIDGKYTIDVAPNDVIEFSSIGYETLSEPVGKRSVINVSLKDNVSELDDVVVMGYSSQRKTELASAVVTVKSETLKDVTTSDVAAMLQGKISGAQIINTSGQPGSRATINIRGAGSISASTQPLYVVDGIQGGSFDPNDVETITVLKDAGATAIYGSAAAGGVIIVTTKKGRTGQPTRLNFKTSYGVTEALQGNFRMMDGAELYEAHRYMKIANRPETLSNQNFDWLGAAFGKGNVKDHYLSLTGANDMVNYYASINAYDQKGTLINTNYNRVSGRLNLDIKLAKKLDLIVRGHYSQSKNREPQSYTTSQGGYDNMPWDNPYDVNGNVLKINDVVRPDNGETWYTQEKRNFLHNELYNYAKSKSSQLTNDAQLNWKVFDWVTLTSSNRFSKGGYKHINYSDSRTNSASYSEQGYLVHNISDYSSWMTSLLAKLNKSFGKHRLNGLVGWEYGEGYTEYNSTQVIDLPAGMDVIGPGKPLDDETTSYIHENAGWSVFGQAQYNYNERYFFTASLRADASSKFGKNYRVGYFPSVSASWLVSNENFFPKNNVLTMLKVRANYGATGNDNIPMFKPLSLYNFGATYQGMTGAMAEILANPELRWESAHMSGIGFDFTFFKRIDLGVELYNLDNKNLLLNVPKSLSTGFFQRMENSGSVRNQGIEVQITSKNITGKDFKWTTDFNIAANKNKVYSLPNGEFVMAAGGTAVRQLVTEGEDIYSWYMPKWLGVDYENGNPVWEKINRDENGTEIGREGTYNVAEAESQIVGRATPKFFGGFNNYFEYKGITLNITTNFVYGNKIYMRDREKYDADGAYVGYSMMSLKSRWNRWEKPGDVASHPRLAQNGNHESNKTSSRYLEDGSFFRIKNIQLGYNLPQKWIKAIGMQACRIYVSGDNLFTFTKFSGMDPEVSLERSNWSLAGMYSYSYPISKQYLMGLEIQF